MHGSSIHRSRMAGTDGATDRAFVGCAYRTGRGWPPIASTLDPLGLQYLKSNPADGMLPRQDQRG